MKNKILTFVLTTAVFTFPSFMYSQGLTASAFYNNDSAPTTYLGIDFTLAKLGNGFGFRNYWASAIKNAIGHLKSKDYNQ